jgi:hypothetical protein
VRTVDAGAALAFAADGLAVAAGGFNAAWLALHWIALERRGRRLAAVVLALVNAGIALQAAFAQALYSAHRLGLDVEPFYATAPWLASRITLLAGTLLLSALILRRSPQ